MRNLTNALIADMASIIGNFYSHSAIDNMFLRLAAAGDPPASNKIIKVQTWLRQANDDPT